MDNSSPIILALREELNRALKRVEELEIAEISAPKETDGLLKGCSDERTMLRASEHEKVQSAFVSISEELEQERSARRRLQMENRKLLGNLGEASKALKKAEKEVSKERESRKLLEYICNELAIGIRENKAEVEELKRKNARDREEIDEERRALVLIEAWREERVQMKLNEAKLELEERCMALDKVKAELDMYLNSMKDYKLESALDPLSGILLTDSARCRPTQFSQDKFAAFNDAIRHSNDSGAQSDQRLVNRKSSRSRGHIPRDICSSKHVEDKFGNVCIDCDVKVRQQSSRDNSKVNMKFRKESQCKESTLLAATRSNYFRSNAETSQEMDWDNPKVNDHVNRLYDRPWIGNKMASRKERGKALYSRENKTTWENHVNALKSESGGSHWDCCDEHGSNLEEECSNVSEIDDEDDGWRSFLETKKQPCESLKKWSMGTVFPYLGHNHFNVAGKNSEGLPPVPSNSPMYKHSGSPDFCT